MTKDKKFYILGKVFHQDDSDPIELLGEADDENGVSAEISSLMNQSFPPKNIFVIEGIRHEISIKAVSID